MNPGSSSRIQYGDPFPQLEPRECYAHWTPSLALRMRSGQSFGRHITSTQTITALRKYHTNLEVRAQVRGSRSISVAQLIPLRWMQVLISDEEMRSYFDGTHLGSSRVEVVVHACRCLCLCVERGVERWRWRGNWSSWWES